MEERFARQRTPPPVPAAARELWRQLAGDPSALRPGTVTVVQGSRGICPPRWTGVVRLGDAVVIERGGLDDESLEILRTLADPSDPDQVRAALAPAETLGPGHLFYLPEGFRPSDPQDHDDLDVLPVERLAAWLADLASDEVDESGVAALDEAMVLRRAGEIVGAGGHHDWPADTAHLGIVVDPRFRGSGAGVVVGTASTLRALDLGRHPQWRAAGWNGPSQSVARRIGYVQFGRQFSFALAD